MGNTLPARGFDAVTRYHHATTWIEGAAEQQIHNLTTLPGFMRMAVFPDIHPGKFGPVGIAADFEELVHPALIGTDIGCGVALAATDTDARKLHLDKISERLSDALTERDYAEAMSGCATGSIGGGNHFCELTRIKEVFIEAHDLSIDKVHIMVHSGSRALGAEVFGLYRNEYGTGPLQGAEALAYLERHDTAVAFAGQNRLAVIERAASALRSGYALISDVPHNHVERSGNHFRHRKGASSSDRGLCVVLGSRGALSYLVEPLQNGDDKSLCSIAHGAGRKFDRAGARARFGGKGVLEREGRNPFGGRIICNDRKLAAEESAGAYKPIGPVIEDLVSFGLVRVIASLQPLVTWKTAGEKR